MCFVHACVYNAHVEVRRQPAGVKVPLLPYWSKGLNLGHQACCQVDLTLEPSHSTILFILGMNVCVCVPI